MWTYRYLAAAVAERAALVPREKAALINAEAKLAALGPGLPYPHSSAVQGADRLRELRPRGGRSPWRALYRQIGESSSLPRSGRRLRPARGALPPRAAGQRPG
jgi:hypothetical protein